MTTQTNPTRHLGVRVPADLADAVRRRAVEEERSVSSVVRRALKAHLGDIDPVGRSGGAAGRPEGGR
jgi:hypothetical protein